VNAFEASTMWVIFPRTYVRVLNDVPWVSWMHIPIRRLWRRLSTPIFLRRE